MIKALLASTVVAFGLLFSGMAHADDECVSSKTVVERNYTEGKAHGLTLEAVTLKGDDAAKVREFVINKWPASADKVIAFDEVTFIANTLDETSDVLMVLYDKGCAVSGGNITAQEFVEVVVTVTGERKGI